MSTKGERTRAGILRKTAELMNRQGFLAAPLSAVIEATGIQKGGLYRHFESRDALAEAALEHAVDQVRERFQQALVGRHDARERLLAIVHAHGRDSDGIDVPLPGGCPIMNCAIESDHAHPALRERARAAMSGWQGLLVRIVEAGLRAGEIRAGTCPQEVASTLTACMEGAVMLTQLYGDVSHWRAAQRHLEHYIEHDLAPCPAASSLKGRTTSC
ncbi:MAG TPA: TetR/AcrR family transcriptional regulator [Albitalea sp.]|nr:TetR/AcrR family transcriptional regulator [Albitalea sp.]